MMVLRSVCRSCPFPWGSPAEPPSPKIISARPPRSNYKILFCENGDEVPSVEDAVYCCDICGVCGGSGEIYECGCSNIAVGTCDCYNNILDECDICGGDNTSCTGCTDPNASNHDPEAIIDDGSCILDIDNLPIIPEIFSS